MFYTKEKAKTIQGIAILLMIYHHLFMQNENYYHVSIIGIETELHLAWFAKICVALLTFVSGYGVCLKLSHIMNNYCGDSLFELFFVLFKDICCRIFYFLKTYWFIFIIFVPLFIWKGTIHNILDVIGGALLINYDFSGGWWYAKQYVLMLSITPAFILMLQQVNKKKFMNALLLTIILLIEIVLAYFYLDIVFLYLAIYIEGVFCCCFSLFEKVGKTLQDNKIWKAISLLAIVSLIITRIFVVKSADDARIDLIITPFFVFFISMHNDNLGIYKIGAISAYMWLISTAIQAVFNKYFFAMRYSLMIYLSLTMTSLIISHVCLNIRKLFINIYEKTR